MSSVYAKQLLPFVQQLQQAGHGQKEAIYQQAAEHIGVSRATAFSHLNRLMPKAPRKRRSDAGEVLLPLHEAKVISGYLMDGYRKNNRKITSLKEAVKVLRSTGEILAGRIDEQSGKLRYLSESAISRALTQYVLHPEQLRQATPHTRLKSKHPNHVWQVDGSVCVLYYLPDGGAELVELDEAVHYKNKPQNLKAIEQFRVIRYVVTDHASGLVRYRYYPHAETGQHTVRFIAWAMAPKTGNDPFQGAPFIIMVDPGATGGGLVKRFCHCMGIELIVNKPRNPRAKGSVEKGNHLVETSFEQALRYSKKRPANFQQINEMAAKYQLWWNATKIHTRHKQPRLTVWLTIKPEQLRTTPGEEVLLSLATQEAVQRKVNGDLTVNFKNKLWSVKAVPGVFIGDKLQVHWHPFMSDTAMAVVFDADGREQHIALPEMTQDELGFYEHAALIGEEYKAQPDTIADSNRKAVQQLAAGTSSLEATEKKRERKDYLPFDGRIDPFKPMKDNTLPDYMPKRGTALDIKAPQVQLLRMNTVQMAKWLHGRLAENWDSGIMADIKQRFPEGATEPELEHVLTDLQAGRSAAGKAKLQQVK